MNIRVTSVLLPSTTFGECRDRETGLIPTRAASTHRQNILWLAPVPPSKFRYSNDCTSSMYHLQSLHRQRPFRFKS